MSNKRGLSGIYLILIVFGIALLWTLGLGILAREEVYLGLSPTVVVG